MNILLRKIKITKIKLGIAGVLYRLLRLFFRKERYVVKRHSITIELDLNEGIDLHVFLFGNFQKHITDNSMINLPDDGVVFDVGANAGIISLIFADKLPYGHVHAFEPTDYAISKFRRNLALNPDQSSRISLTQCFISSVDQVTTSMRAYSSWPIFTTQQKHAIHCGVDMTTDGVKAITLDGYCEQQQVSRIDLIKIDTDGHEMEVLQGASGILEKYHPAVIFEIGAYMMKEHGLVMDDYLSFFSSHGYQLYTLSGDCVLADNNERIIPQFGTVDLIALPAEGRQFDHVQVIPS